VGQGVRKHALYFLWPSYWGIVHAHVIDAIEIVEQSEDEDVLAEEAEVQSRLNAPMAPHSAIEIRGLRATFKRRGKDFHAVKAPWLCIAKRQLFALLGPNGAGKTTVINMLTGFLPASIGNAYDPIANFRKSIIKLFRHHEVSEQLNNLSLAHRLVFDETVVHSSGMARIRRMMGVCPQAGLPTDPNPVLYLFNNRFVKI
jgi:ABC-type glutathione transport system ATPase component